MGGSNRLICRASQKFRFLKSLGSGLGFLREQPPDGQPPPRQSPSLVPPSQGCRPKLTISFVRAEQPLIARIPAAELPPPRLSSGPSRPRPLGWREGCGREREAINRAAYARRGAPPPDIIEQTPEVRQIGPVALPSCNAILLW